ncbi:peptidoglycan recognition family protein [Porticoccaceae bacterium LTM1]|nr:peptidoglycan recognition family protein [Porticoccaceae bacterium LTM1]
MNRRKFLIGSTLALAGFTTGSYFWPRRWNYIVIHHSAGNFGTIEFLQQVHRERQSRDPIDAIPYHYVIGNGNGLAMGEIASDWRKEYHIWGTHVSTNNRDRNFRGIGICLIGNFEEQTVPKQQYDALINLVKSLMIEHQIPVSNISGHGYTPGEHTKCPGKNFPMEKFLEDLSILSS